MKRVALLGSTGSIGTQTLEVVAQFPQRFRVVALSAGTRTERLAEQVRAFSPALVSVASAAGAADLRARLSAKNVSAPKITVGDAGLVAVAECDADIVVSALVGAVGLRPTLAAIQKSRRVALANKEALVMAGALLTRARAEHGAELLPVDSEHSAIFQALAAGRRSELARVILTASGGPFRTWSAARMARASREEALAHPVWNMGPKISVDSATLMNKALEVIEARWLFDLAPQEVQVVVHPQAIVHSLVEFVDGSLLAQLAAADMKLPIALALSHPERLPLVAERLDLTRTGALEFEAPDHARFPSLALAFRALEGAETAPAVLNAANELSVAAFLEGRIAFGDIARVNAQVLGAYLKENSGARAHDLPAVQRADAEARERATQQLRKREAAA